MKRFALALFIVLCCGVTAAQDLVVYPSGGRLLGACSAPTPGKWVVFGAGFLPIQPTVYESGALMTFQGPPGTYGVVFFPSGDGVPVVTRITLEGDVPNPPDPPNPDEDEDDPNPPPVPGAKYQMMMFYDADQLDDYHRDQRALLTSLAVRKRLIAEGHTVLEILEAKAIRDGVPSKYRLFVEAVMSDPLPRIALAPVGGGKVLDFPLPRDEAALMKLLESPEIAEAIQ